MHRNITGSEADLAKMQGEIKKRLNKITDLENSKNGMQVNSEDTTKEQESLCAKVPAFEDENSSYKLNLDQEIAKFKDVLFAVHKKIHTLEKAKLALEIELVKLNAKNKKLENNLQISKDAKLRLELKMQSWRLQAECDSKANFQQVEQKYRVLMKKLLNCEAELKETRRQNAVVVIKKVARVA